MCCTSDELAKMISYRRLRGPFVKFTRFPGYCILHLMMSF
ncbi:hypothetical protein EDO6_06447 [Paenibacillus xylanexedens]|nr:hypothetical protein EDO6_06447 [Paenibacillus xylanexedens]